MSTVAIELPPARAALRAAAARCADLIASLPDLDVRLPRSEWTVGDTAAHLAIALQGFTDAATGHVSDASWRPLVPPDSTGFPDRMVDFNQATLSAQPRRPPAAASQAITEAATGFLDASAGMPPAEEIQTPWYGDGVTHTVLSATCLLLGEQVIHGYDIAQAVGRPWSISSEEACLVFEGVRRLMPLMVNRDESGERCVTYQLHIGRSSRFVVRVAGGAATVDPPGPIRVDCHIAGTPSAILLVGYGRISQWRAIASGRLIAWGRKPWLGFRFVKLFFNP